MRFEYTGDGWWRITWTNRQALVQVIFVCAVNATEALEAWHAAGHSLYH